MTTNNRPNAVVMVTVCPEKQEAIELTLHKKQVEALRKAYKGRCAVRGRPLQIRLSCPHCGKEHAISVPKEDAKRMWNGMRQETVQKADVAANRGLENRR